MDGLNEVKLIGNVGRDVELKHLDNDRKVARVVIATNRTHKKQNGEKESRTEWHNVEFWGDTAQFCGDYIKKGMLLYINGELRTDSYEKEGVKQYRSKIAGSDVKILSSGGSSGGSNHSEQASTSVEGVVSTETARQQSQQYVAEPTSANVNEATSIDEDLPF